MSKSTPESLTAMKTKLTLGTAASVFALTATCAFTPLGATLAADSAALLSGKAVSSTGEPLAGIPIKAHRDSSGITVAVYTDTKGEYSFPTWSDLTPGSYSVAVDLPDFKRVANPIMIVQ